MSAKNFNSKNEIKKRLSDDDGYQSHPRFKRLKSIGKLENGDGKYIIYKKKIDWKLKFKDIYNFNDNVSYDKVLNSPLISVGPNNEVKSYISINKETPEVTMFNISWILLTNIKKENINTSMSLIIENFNSVIKLDNFHNLYGNIYNYDEDDIDDENDFINYDNDNDDNTEPVFFITKKDLDLIKIRNLITNKNNIFNFDDIDIKLSIQFELKINEKILKSLAYDIKNIFNEISTTDLLIKIINEQNFENLQKDYNKQKEIKNEITEFHVHKFILISRSIVFKAMFQHDCKESLTNVIEIKNTSPKAFKYFLRYLYLNEIFNEDDNHEDFVHIIINLIDLSNKYMIEQLKYSCQIKLIELVKLNNVLLFYKISKLYNLKKLKKKTSTMIYNYYNKPSYKTFIRECEKQLNKNELKKLKNKSNIITKKNIPIDIIIIEDD